MLAVIEWGPYRAGLDQPFAAEIDARVGPLDDEFAATCGDRDNAEQAIEFAKGRDAEGNVVDPDAVVTDAKPGDSSHNYHFGLDVARKTPTGLRWDYVVRPDGTLDPERTHPAWFRLVAAIRASALLHSGLDFPGDFKDPDHIERLNWRQHTAPDAQVAA